MPSPTNETATSRGNNSGERVVPNPILIRGSSICEGAMKKSTAPIAVNTIAATELKLNWRLETA